MINADVILKNAILLTINDKFDIFEPGALVIKKNLIADCGDEKEILSLYEADEIIDCGGKILMPGLVNAHTHMSMAVFRGVMDDLRLDEWLLNYIFPIEGKFMNSETAKLGTELACAELIQSGVTCCNDMYYYEKAVSETLIKVGMRGFCTRLITSFPGVDNVPVEEKFKLAEEHVEKYKNHPLINPSIAPHAPYTNSEETIKHSIEFAKKHDIMLNMHLAETSKEVADICEKYGSLNSYLDNLGFYDCKLNFAHCVYLSDEDIKAFAKHNVGVAHNPESNMKLSSGSAPVTAMLAAGVNVGIGTDGNSSNNDLDMFSEMRSASFLAKIQANSPVALTAKEVIYMVTRGGAKSVFLEDKIGSLEKGKHADLILVDINTLHNLPRFRHNPDGLYGQLVYAAKSTDVTDVMCEGKWLMRNRKLQTIDEKPLLEKAQSKASEIDAYVNELKSKKSE
ncbi:MAG: amidohydrolase [Candidatus Riflebacteria bacterium]|nr:amidohydrolase [Candidatus Riflebacteria bacterium]